MNQQHLKAIAALKNMFVADALSMPVHWYYNPHDIEKAFPGGITRLESAPEYHPSSIMSLHSTSKGGRGKQTAHGHQREIVGEVILKGRRQYWNQPGQHYHRGMLAGENTLNAHCARVLMKSLATNNGHYNKQHFVDAYIALMTTDPPVYPDTYAESYHRGFFANLESGKAKERCGALTHDTASIGGLVTIAPLVLAERLAGTSLDKVQVLCREHLFLTHPDNSLADTCAIYVELLDQLLFRTDEPPPFELIAHAARRVGLNLSKLLAKARDDREVVGGLFSSACYISDSWPSALYLAGKYLTNPRQALLANTNLGGDNVHRGAVLGVILGLATAHTVAEDYEELADKESLNVEINALLKLSAH